MIKWRISIATTLLGITSSSVANPSLLFASYFKALTHSQQQTLSSDMTGLAGAPLTNAEKRLKINQIGDFNAGHAHPKRPPLTLKQIKHQAETGKQQIALAIEPYGYFKPKISYVIRQKGQHFFISYTVQKGPPLRITHLNLRLVGEGEQNAMLVKQLQNVPLKQQAIFTTQAYNATTDQLVQAARQLGYIKANLRVNRILINRQAYTCTIEIILDSEHRYYFGSTTFSPSPLSPTLLKRYLTFKPGEVYSEQKLMDLQHKLSGSGYFRHVTVKPDLQHSHAYQVPIHVDVTKNYRKAYELGLGYGTGTGPRATVGVNWRYVNAYGHKFKARAQVSEVSNSFALQYIIPGRDPTRNQYTLTANSFYLDPQDGQSRGQNLGIGYLTQQGDFKNAYQLFYLHEVFRFQKNQPHQSSHALIPTLTFQRVKLDKPINPTQGSDLTLMLRAASRYTSASFEFAQADMKYAHLFSLSHYNRLLLRGHLGYTTVHERDDLPLSLNYYAGGATTLRGFDSYAFGPGRYLLLGTAELRQRLYGNLWAAIFIDEGSAFDHFDETLHRGVGVGLLYHSPVGPIEISIARGDMAKRKDPFLTQYKLQFTVGML